MMLQMILGTFALGVLLGGLGGLFGIGGGLIAIPVLGMSYGMDQHGALRDQSRGCATAYGRSSTPPTSTGYW
jgi:uncharacterized membrane protein YfcA